MSGDDSPTDDSTINTRRRQLLAALGSGAAAGLAGCGGDGGGGSPTASPTATATDFKPPTQETATATETQTSTGDEGTPTATPTPKGLQQTNRVYKTFFGAQLAKLNWDIFNHREDWPRKVAKASLAFKASTDQSTGNLIPMWVQEWSVTDKKIEFGFRPKEEWPKWYKGIPSEDGAKGIIGRVRPSDWGVMEIIERWRGLSPEEIKNSDRGTPRNWWEAITDITWDDDEGTLTFHSKPGWFSMFRMGGVPNALLTNVGPQNQGRKIALKVDHNYPPRGKPIRPYNQYKDMDWVERRKKLTGGGPSTPEPLEYSPTEIPTSGVFTPTDVTEQHVMMENPGYYVDEMVHYNDDAINWPKMKQFSMPQNNLRNKALTSGRLDGINGTYVAPANVLQQLPDRYKTWLHNQSATSGFALNGMRVKWFKDPRVRKAILWALDKKALANQGHRFANASPQGPMGLLNPPYKQWVSDDFAKSLDVYSSQDTERATKLLQMAGFTKKGGTWRTPEGKKFSINLLTTTSNVQVPAVAIQNLKNFGIEMALVTNSASTVGAKKSRGDYEMVSQGWWIPHIGLWTRAIQQSARRHKFGLIKDKAVDKFVNKFDNVVNREYEWTNNLENVNPEQWKFFTLPMPDVANGGMSALEAPPVHEWPMKNAMRKAPSTSGWSDIPVFYYAHTWGSVTSDSKSKEWMRNLAWGTNTYVPYTQFAISAQVAVQDHGQWQAPNKRKPWRQDEPVNKLISQGKIHANPKE